MKKLTLLLLLTTQISFSQTKIVVDIINQIEFKEDTIKSVYDWITDNIKYDVNKFNEINKGKSYNKNLKFKSEEDYKDYLLKKVIQQKKGVCEDYALLFHSIVRQLGYEAYIITGYAKDIEGKIQTMTGHAWNAVNYKGWKLYDPTWGAGYLKDDKFVKKYNQEWFDVSSGEMIKTHMPFDPIWQLSNKPISYKEFDNNIKIADSREIYNYDELIESHYNKEKKDQMKDAVDRSVALGDGLKLVDHWRETMLKNISFYGIYSQQDLINEASLKANNTIDILNQYIAAKNRRFKGGKWTIDYAKQNLNVALLQIESVLDIYRSIEVEDKGAVKSIKKSIADVKNIQEKIKKELKYIQEYKPN